MVTDTPAKAGLSGNPVARTAAILAGGLLLPVATFYPAGELTDGLGSPL
jgi:hypothetical protein